MLMDRHGFDFLLHDCDLCLDETVVAVVDLAFTASDKVQFVIGDAASTSILSADLNWYTCCGSDTDSCASTNEGTH
jgi:hypothetical protein